MRYHYEKPQLYSSMYGRDLSHGYHPTDHVGFKDETTETGTLGDLF